MKNYFQNRYIKVLNKLGYSQKCQLFHLGKFIGLFFKLKGYFWIFFG